MGCSSLLDSLFFTFFNHLISLIILKFLKFEENNHSPLGGFSQKKATFVYPMGRNPSVQKAFSLVLYLEIANFKCRRTTQRMPLLSYSYMSVQHPVYCCHTRYRRGVIIFFRSFDNGVWRYQRYEDESNNQVPRLLCTQSLTPEFGGAWMAAVIKHEEIHNLTDNRICPRGRGSCLRYTPAVGNPKGQGAG